MTVAVYAEAASLFCSGFGHRFMLLRGVIFQRKLCAGFCCNVGDGNWQNKTFRRRKLCEVVGVIYIPIRISPGYRRLQSADWSLVDYLGIPFFGWPNEALNICTVICCGVSGTPDFISANVEFKLIRPFFLRGSSLSISRTHPC